MERFTKKIDGVWTALCKYGSSPLPIVTQEIIDRLAAYEDTGLTPEEVQIQKEAMESMGWFGKMFQRYKGDPRGPIGTLGTELGKSLALLNVESAKNRQPVKDVDGNTWLPVLLDEFRSMADVIEHGQEWIPGKVRLHVQDYCHRCPDFEAEVTGGPSAVYNTEGERVEILMADTVIKCTRAEKCAWVVGEAFRCRKGEPQEKGEECCE